MVDGYDAFELYIAIKLTYDTSANYDFWRYGGKTNTKKESFTKRKDRRHFYVLAKRMNFDRDAIRDYLFVNMLYKHDAWIGDLLNEDCSDRYKQYQRYRNSFKYAFTEEAKQLKNTMETRSYEFNELLSPKYGVPKLMELFYSEQVTPYLLHGFHRVFRILDKWNTERNVFEPILTAPLQRLTLAQNWVFPLTSRLTTADFGDILKATFVEE